MRASDPGRAIGVRYLLCAPCSEGKRIRVVHGPGLTTFCPLLKGWLFDLRQQCLTASDRPPSGTPVQVRASPVSQTPTQVPAQAPAPATFQQTSAKRKEPPASPTPRTTTPLTNKRQAQAPLETHAPPSKQSLSTVASLRDQLPPSPALGSPKSIKKKQSSESCNPSTLTMPKDEGGPDDENVPPHPPYASAQGTAVASAEPSSSTSASQVPAQLQPQDNTRTQHTALKDVTNHPYTLPSPSESKGHIVDPPSSNCTGEAQPLFQVTRRPLRATGEALSVTRALKHIACDNLHWARVEGGIVRLSVRTGLASAHLLFLCVRFVFHGAVHNQDAPARRHLCSGAT